MPATNLLKSPDIDTLKDAKAFDDFKQSPNWQERLELLKSNPHPYARIRYAWYKHYKGFPQQTLVLLAGLPERYPLARVLYMDALIELSRHDELLEMQAGWKPYPDDVEATIIGYEVMAFTHAVILKDYHQAFRLLYRAEGLAVQYGLRRRLSAIQTNIENVANMSGTEIALEQIRFPDVFANGLVQITRFRSNLRAGNLIALKEDKFISPNVLNLAKATIEYNCWYQTIGSIVNAGRLISESVPNFPEFRVFWSLLMLQIFTKKGNLQGIASPYRIVSTLEKALDRMKPSDIIEMIGFTSRVYPLGLLIASKLDKRLVDSTLEVGVIWSDRVRDGVRFGDEKRITIPSRVRSAFVEDGLEGSFHHTQAVFNLHATYKQRLHQALAELGLSLPEITNIGSVYRGLNNLGKEIKHTSAIYHANKLLENSSYLQRLVNP